MTSVFCACCSVDGIALPIDELKGTKPTEIIDLSCKDTSLFGAKKLGVASCFIIAACIKENAVLKELKCAARPFASATALKAFDADNCSRPVLAASTTTS